MPNYCGLVGHYRERLRPPARPIACNCWRTLEIGGRVCLRSATTLEQFPFYAYPVPMIEAGCVVDRGSLPGGSRRGNGLPPGS